MTTRPVATPAVRWVVRTLEDAGYETWTVGGAVRDACLGRPSGDWDFATRATPGQVRRLFRRTVPIGIEHGTVGVLARDGTLFEVTTFRRDVQTDGRHAVVSFAETLEEDLARRDFTINAIAWHPIRDELRDPFDGLGDLERGVLRTVGEPGERFSEDYLRILRALRFAGYFDLEVDEATWRSLGERVDRLPGLSAERVREELLKVLDLDADPSRSLGLYAESGALAVLYPELEAVRIGTGDGAEDGAGGGAWALAVAAVSSLPRRRPWLRLAALLSAAPPRSVAAVLVRLKLSNARTDEVARLASAAPLPSASGPERDVRAWLSLHGPDRLHGIARVQLARARAEASLGGADRTGDVVRSWALARAVRAARPPLSVAELAIDGRHLISMGLQPGPRFGPILESLLEWVLEDPSRNDVRLLEERVRTTVTEAPDD